MFIRIIFGWLRLPNVFNISTLPVTSADNSKATENAAFALMEWVKKIDVNLPIFSLYKNINIRTNDSTSWRIHDSHVIQTNTITFLDTLKKMSESDLIFSARFWFRQRVGEYEKEREGNCLVPAICQVLNWVLYEYFQ